MCGDLVNTYKVIKTINSCETLEQLEVAFNMMRHLKHQWQWERCYSVLEDKLHSMWDYDVDHEYAAFDYRIFMKTKEG